MIKGAAKHDSIPRQRAAAALSHITRLSVDENSLLSVNEIARQMNKESHLNEQFYLWLPQLPCEETRCLGYVIHPQANHQNIFAFWHANHFVMYPPHHTDVAFSMGVAFPDREFKKYSAVVVTSRNSPNPHDPTDTSIVLYPDTEATPIEHLFRDLDGHASVLCSGAAR